MSRAVLVLLFAVLGCGTRTISQSGKDGGDPIVVPEVCSALGDRTKCPGGTHLQFRTEAEQDDCARRIADGRCGSLRATYEACLNARPLCYDDAGKVTNDDPSRCATEKSAWQACTADAG